MPPRPCVRVPPRQASAFEGADGKSGFPAELAGARAADVDNQGRARFAAPPFPRRTASRYLGADAEPLRTRTVSSTRETWVEQHGERCLLRWPSRRGDHVGGQKIHPEESRRDNSHPHVRLSLVRGAQEPITGALVIADVVLSAMPPQGIRARSSTRSGSIARAPAPAPRFLRRSISFALAVSASDKLERRNA